MQTKSALYLSCLWVVILFVAACSPTSYHPVAPPSPQPNAEVPTIIMQHPYDGSVYDYRAGLTVELQTLVRSTGSAISEVTFLVNGASVGAANASQGLTWSPPQVGEYYIQSRAVLSDGATAMSNPVRVCVMSLAQLSWPGGAAGYQGLCEVPTRIPSAASSGSLTIRAFGSPNPIQISTNPACSQFSGVTATIVARVDDPQDLVALAAVDLYLQATGPVELWLNWVTTRPLNQKEYRTSVPLGIPYLSAAPNGAVRWVIKTFDRQGAELPATAEGSIPIQFVDCSQQRLQTSPSNTPATLEIIPGSTPTMTPTPVGPPAFTLKKNAFCRKGPDMSFPDVTGILAGTTVDILNVSEDGFWYFIYWKQFKTKCWVAASTGDVNGDVSGIKVLAGPDTPEPAAPPKKQPSPTPCNSLTHVCP